MKIIIIGNESNTKLELAKLIQDYNDDLVIAPIFTTDLNYEGHISDDCLYYLPQDEVELAYKNNAFMWVYTTTEISKGVTLVDMYSSDIFPLSYGEFNNISNPILETLKEDSILVWLDSKQHNDNDKFESTYATERLSECNYLYFCDDNLEEVRNIIIDYLLGNKEKRAELLNEYN